MNDTATAKRIAATDAAASAPSAPAAAPTFRLTCGSTADLTRARFEERDIPFVCFHYSLDGEEFDDDLGASLPYDELYRRIAAGADTRTSQANIAEHLALFEPILEAGEDILYIALSSGISGSFSSAENAARIARERFPERTIHVVDSLAASSGYGMLVEAAADLRDAGKSVDEVRDWVEANKLRLHHWYFSMDLSHYIRGGRISKVAGAAAGVLNICLLMDMNDKGELIVRHKVRGAKKVVKDAVAKMQELAVGGLAYEGKCYMSHSACLDDAIATATLIERTFDKLDGRVRIYDVGATIGCHTGPGTVAFFFWSDTPRGE